MKLDNGLILAKGDTFYRVHILMRYVYLGNVDAIAIGPKYDRNIVKGDICIVHSDRDYKIYVPKKSEFDEELAKVLELSDDKLL